MRRTVAGSAWTGAQSSRVVFVGGDGSDQTCLDPVQRNLLPASRAIPQAQHGRHVLSARQEVDQLVAEGATQGCAPLCVPLHQSWESAQLLSGYPDQSIGRHQLTGRVQIAGTVGCEPPAQHLRRIHLLGHPSKVVPDPGDVLSSASGCNCRRSSKAHGESATRLSGWPQRTVCGIGRFRDTERVDDSLGPVVLDVAGR